MERVAFVEDATRFSLDLSATTEDLISPYQASLKQIYDETLVQTRRHGHGTRLQWSHIRLDQIPH